MTEYQYLIDRSTSIVKNLNGLKKTSPGLNLTNVLVKVTMLQRAIAEVDDELKKLSKSPTTSVRKSAPVKNDVLHSDVWGMVEI